MDTTRNFRDIKFETIITPLYCDKVFSHHESVIFSLEEKQFITQLFSDNIYNPAIYNLTDDSAKSAVKQFVYYFCEIAHEDMLKNLESDGLHSKIFNERSSSFSKALRCLDSCLRSDIITEEEWCDKRSQMVYEPLMKDLITFGEFEEDYLKILKTIPRKNFTPLSLEPATLQPPYLSLFEDEGDAAAGAGRSKRPLERPKDPICLAAHFATIATFYRPRKEEEFSLKIAELRQRYEVSLTWNHSLATYEEIGRWLYPTDHDFEESNKLLSVGLTVSATNSSISPITPITPYVDVASGEVGKIKSPTATPNPLFLPISTIRSAPHGNEPQFK